MTQSTKQFININDVPSYVETWGCSLEEETPKEVIIFIPGNPGRIGFYVPYLQHLHELTNIPVWTISHIGHEEKAGEILDSADLGSTFKLSGKYDLEPQLMQKESFILKYTKESTKVYLIGHSIGAWMVMQLLKNQILRRRVQTKLLIFPTIQKMAESPNGRWLNGTIRNYYSQILFVVRYFYKLPSFLRLFFVRMFLFFNAIPKQFEDACLKTAVPSIVEKVLFLAFDEMDKVRELDFQTLLLIKENLYIIYNDYDGWAPKQYFDEIKSYDLDIPLKCVPYSHSFTLKSSLEFATLSSHYFSKSST